MLKDGRTLVGGPDHYARLSAAKYLREFLLSGRPLCKEEDRSKRLFTLEEIQAALAQNQAERLR